MKVKMNIEQDEVKTGFFKKKLIHRVAATVEFTPEERNAIVAGGLDKYELFSYPASPDMLEYALEKHPHLKGRFPVEVEHFLAGKSAKPPYPDVLQAQRAMAELKENLVSLKSVIESVSAPQGESFEL